VLEKYLLAHGEAFLGIERELHVVKHTFGPNRPQLITVICKSAAENGYITRI
jgi:hypothetical protein